MVKMTENKEMVVKKDNLTQTVSGLFAKKTPAKFIKTRPGPNGKLIKYVEIGYIVNELNNAFGPFWEFQVIDKQIGKEQVWVQGRLTVKERKTNFSITKENFGGADIKFSSRTSKPIDIANDLKSATSDCIKKCASMFGIASDVFFKEQDQYDQMATIIDDKTGIEESVIRLTMNKLFAVGAESGFSPEDLKETLKPHFGVTSMNDLTVAQVEKAIKTLESNYQQVPHGEKPLKVNGISKVEVAPVDLDEEENKPNLCRNIKCIKGPNGTRKAVAQGEYFCSEECQHEYWGETDDKKEKMRRFEEFLNTKKMSPKTTANGYLAN